LMEAIFWLCVVAATYSYFWYPALLLVLPQRSCRHATQTEPVRRIGVVIAARNEAGKISEKIDNTLALGHAGVELDIIVASDASDDTTDEIVRSYGPRGVRLARSDVRRGKEYAQGLAVAATDAELIVFTDAGTVLPEDALLHV